MPVVAVELPADDLIVTEDADVDAAALMGLSNFKKFGETRGSEMEDHVSML